MGDESVRWTVVVDKETDRNLRMRLAERGLKKGDLSKFIEDAVNRTLFMQTVDEVRGEFKDLTAEEAEELANQAVEWARKARR